MDIKSVIKSKGYTLERLANELTPKVTKGALSQSINNNPTIQTLQRIADVIGCRVGDFFADDMTPQQTPETRPNDNRITCPCCGAALEIKAVE